MKFKIVFYSALLMMISSLAQAQPAIRATNGVVNASSELPDIARGSWFVVFGTGLGPASISVQNGAPYPAALSGTSITFTPASGGTPVSALMYYTLATQAAGMLPSSTPTGAYDVKVTYNQKTSTASRVNVVERNFGFATQASNGQGPAQATYGGYDLNRFTTGTLGQWSLRPAKPGDAMVLWGTGIGADTASDSTGGSSGDQTAAGQVQVIVGGIAVTPGYAGRSYGSPGLDQINFTVPSTVTPSCFVSLQVSAGGRLSNLGSIAIAAGGQTACSSPTLTQAQLQKLDTGGAVIIGSLHLGKTTTTLTASGLSATTQSELVDGWFGKYTVDTIGTADFTLDQSGACFLIQRTGTVDQIGFGLAQAPLDAGTKLTLNGPNAVNTAIARQADGSYGSTLYSSGLMGVGAAGSPTLAQGAYTLSGTGGADVGAFSATVNLPGDFTWTNKNSMPNSIPRAQPLNLTWTGAAGGLVTIAGSAMTQVTGSYTNGIYSATIFNCTVPAAAGNFTVPSSVLQQLPAVSGDATGSSFGILSLIASPDATKGQGTFTAPLSSGGTLDQGILSYGVTFTKTTGYN